RIHSAAGRRWPSALSPHDGLPIWMQVPRGGWRTARLSGDNRASFVATRRTVPRRPPRGNMLWQALTSVRDIGRLHDIASVLVRYGFGDLVRRLGLGGVLERAGHALNWHAATEYAQLAPPARVRRAFEELGPSFVKLGQMLASRVDLLEPGWIAEFGKLQDRAPAVPYEQVREQLVQDLGAPPETVFAEFDPEPMAAASIAQVYRARTHEGEDVVLKARRPGIRPVVGADLRLMARIAALIEAESPELRAFRPQQVVRRFARTLRGELDFVAECRNACRIAANFAGSRDDGSTPETAAVPPGL